MSRCAARRRLLLRLLLLQRRVGERYFTREAPWVNGLNHYYIIRAVIWYGSARGRQRVSERHFHSRSPRLPSLNAVPRALALGP